MSRLCTCKSALQVMLFQQTFFALHSGVIHLIKTVVLCNKVLSCTCSSHSRCHYVVTLVFTLQRRSMLPVQLEHHRGRVRPTTSRCCAQRLHTRRLLRLQPVFRARLRRGNVRLASCVLRRRRTRSRDVTCHIKPIMKLGCVIFQLFCY